ncbi:MAG: polysaccharide biosynthesis C-terminal domain-containing protein, partial [Anaerolineales bacterium]|nr:polysaccharide biosynthesis C-terminal domain-containing protein [Anaerolineales bacterium]
YLALRISVWSTLANVSAALLLIPLWGAAGAAIASVFSLVVALMISYAMMNRNLFNLDKSTLVTRPLGSYMLAFLLGLSAKQLGLSWQSALSIFVISAALLLVVFGAISKHDVKGIYLIVSARGKHSSPEGP